MNEPTGQSFRERFNVNTPEMQERADAQTGRALRRHLARACWDHEYNCDHYDPRAKMTPEEREAI